MYIRSEEVEALFLELDEVDKFTTDETIIMKDYLHLMNRSDLYRGDEETQAVRKSAACLAYYNLTPAQERVFTNSKLNRLGDF